MASSADLLLQCQHSETAASFSVTANLYDQTEEPDMKACRLEARLLALESEHKKIDAFKRELPLCMQLLHDAIKACKEQLANDQQKHLQRPVSCSFDNGSLDGQSESGDEPFAREKPPSSVHANECEQVGKRRYAHASEDASHWIKVWNPRADFSSGFQQAGCRSLLSLEERSRWYMREEAFSTSARQAFGSKQKLGGAFAPFSRNNRLVQPIPRPGAINPADLAMKCPESATTASRPMKSWDIVQHEAESSADLKLPICTKTGNLPPQQTKGTESDATNGAPMTRKTRRSWSPQLHRLFVDALQKLGGAQATPKQIRELMKVEGLTNDEVKSHLQKYRLHTKRLSLSPPTSSRARCVVSNGQAQTSSEYAASHSYNNTTSGQSLSCETSVSQENVIELCYSGHVHSQVSSCGVTPSTLLNARCLWQGPMQQLKGHPLAKSFRSSDVGGEESVGDAVKPGNSCSKGHHLPRPLSHDEADEIDDRSSNGNQTNSFGEDEKDYEDIQSQF